LPLGRLSTRVRLVVARCHGIYYDDIGRMANRLARGWTVLRVEAR
jgi:hypothetical protein